MVHGRLRERWNHTASVMALIAECNRDRKRRPKAFTPADFHPFMEGTKPSTTRIRITPANIQDLKLLLPPGRPAPAGGAR